jgi:hypothetical protein
LNQQLERVERLHVQLRRHLLRAFRAHIVKPDKARATQVTQQPDVVVA